jgi:hypothetical protein
VLDRSNANRLSGLVIVPNVLLLVRLRLGAQTFDGLGVDRMGSVVVFTGNWQCLVTLICIEIQLRLVMCTTYLVLLVQSVLGDLTRDKKVQETSVLLVTFCDFLTFQKSKTGKYLINSHFLYTLSNTEHESGVTAVNFGPNKYL